MHSNKSPQKQRFCIFCGGSPLTKEHIWPKRWHQLINQVSNQRSHGRTTYNFDDNRKVWEKIELPRIQRIGGTSKTQIRTICKKCNETWVRQIQSDVSPIMEAIILGRDVTLYSGAQALLATWAAVYTAVVDSLHENSTAVSKADRRYLYEHKAVPPSWFVAIGRFDGQGKWSTGYFRYSVGLHRPGSQEGEKHHNIQQTTFTVGHGVFLVSSYNDEISIRDAEGFANSCNLCIIAPIKRVTATLPRFIHNDRTLEKIAYVMNNEIMRLVTNGKLESVAGEMVEPIGLHSNRRSDFSVS